MILRVVSRTSLLFIAILIVLSRCSNKKLLAQEYESNSLKIEQLSDNVFVHITYLNTQEYGKVACNGMIYKNGKEVVVFDTPTNDSVSLELIHWIENAWDSKVKAVVINHFHIDGMGGLQAFHDQGIESYATNLTIKLSEEEGNVIPKNGFDNLLEYELGDKIVVNKHFGPAHTFDNIVSYFPEEKALFGGCMIKSWGASKGNLADANLEEWSNTVIRIKNEYPDLKIVIPGHGKPGGVELLDYTIKLFEVDSTSVK